MSARRAASLSFALLLGGALLASAKADARTEKYFARIERDGAKCGSLRGERRARGAGWSTREHVAIAMRGTRGVEWLRIDSEQREGADGELRNWTRTTTQGRIARALRAERRGGEVRIETSRGSRREERVLAAPGDWLGPVALGERIAELSARESAELNYQELDVAAGEFVRVTLAVASPPAATGGLIALDKRVHGVAGERGYRVAWDPASKRLVEPIAMLGTRLEIVPTSALGRAAFDTPLDALAQLLVESPVRIPRDAAFGTIRYAFEARTGARLAAPETAEQAVTQRGARTVLTLCADCGAEAPPSAAALAAARAPSAWIESDDPRLIRLARRDMDDGAMLDSHMQRLVRRVQKRLNEPVDTLGYASALEALRTRRGDCTEFALLLAALARANGIPARVAFGLVYSSRFTGRTDVFSPHAWVQVWTGARWASYDAGAGPFDATHIALAIGDGSPAAFAEVTRLIPDLRIVAAARIDVSSSP